VSGNKPTEISLQWDFYPNTKKTGLGRWVLFRDAAPLELKIFFGWSVLQIFRSAGPEAAFWECLLQMSPTGFGANVIL
jgi:hypothetical protein